MSDINDLFGGYEEETSSPDEVENHIEEIELPVQGGVYFCNPLENFDPPKELPPLAKEEIDEVEKNSNSPPVPDLTEPETEIEVEVKPDEQEINRTMKMIDGVKRVLDIVSDVIKYESKDSAPVREVKTKPQFDKITFGKPKEINTSFLPKLIFAICACITIGLVFGFQASSYYNFTGGSKEGNLSYAFGWLFALEDPNYHFTLEPFNGSVFGAAFATSLFVVAAILLLIWDSSARKKASRVGHEHGAAHLATPSDFSKYKARFMENNDNNMLFGKYRGAEMGLSLNNKRVNRSANVLVIGGTGTGKTFKYIKPNLLQENASIIVTDPSGDIFRSFAPYLLWKGYNVFLFNASDFSMSNHYNPLLNVYTEKADGTKEISERHVNILVDLYMKNAKAGKEAGGGDPFWDKSEKAFLTAIIYYVLENDAIPRNDKCFATVLQKVQMAKVDDESDDPSPLTAEMNAWFERVGITEDDKTAGGKYKCRQYYDTFLIAPQKTANTILITTAVDLQIFSTKEVDFITREDENRPEMNINIDTIATQQSYLFLGIPQSHQAYNFLIAMLYSQLYGRLYELGEQKLRGKYHIGYKVGTPMLDYFDSKEEAEDFYTHVINDRMAREACKKQNPNATEEEIKEYIENHSNIIEADYINGRKIYRISYNGHVYKSSILKEPLERIIDDIDAQKMFIWAADDFAGGDPSLPIHINFLLDEFKNIGEIPNFLTILSTSRKYRIGSHCVIQDIGQIKTMYKDGEHETLMANVDTVIFLGSNLKEDKEEIQKMLGKTTIRQKSTSSSNSGLSTSYTPTEVDLMSLDEIGAINQGGRDDELVIIRDVTPYLCRKLNLTEHKRWKDVGKAKSELKALGIDVKQYYMNSETNALVKN